MRPCERLGGNATGSNTPNEYFDVMKAKNCKKNTVKPPIFYGKVSACDSRSLKFAWH